MNTMTLDVDLGDTIAEVRGNFLARIHAPADHDEASCLRFTFRGEILDDDRTLRDCDVRKEDTIECSLVRKKASTAPVARGTQIFLRLRWGSMNTMTLDVDLGDTIAEVRGNFLARIHAPADHDEASCLRFTFRGEILDDDR